MANSINPTKGLLIGGYIKQVLDEVRQVSWPSRETTIRLTVMVIASTIAVGVYLGALDYLFTYAMGLII